MINDRLQAIRAQLDEDEQAAREAEKRTTTSRRMVGGRMVEVENRPREWWQASASWSPSRVLREVAAKRKLLDLATAMLETYPADDTARLLLHQAAEEILAQLAASYTDPKMETT